MEGKLTDREQAIFLAAKIMCSANSYIPDIESIYGGYDLPEEARRITQNPSPLIKEYLDRFYICREEFREKITILVDEILENHT